MPLDEIPVTFTYKDKEYKGYFTKVMGAGSSGMFHLTVNGSHWGELWYITGSPDINGLHAVPEGWRFASNQHPDLEKLIDYFSDVVVAWYE